MTEALAPKSKPRSAAKSAGSRLFMLELSGGRIHSMNPDGSDRKVIVTGAHLPDGGRLEQKDVDQLWRDSTPTAWRKLNQGSIPKAKRVIDWHKYAPV